MKYFREMVLSCQLLALTNPVSAAKPVILQRPVASDSMELAEKFYNEPWEFSSMRLEVLKRINSGRDCQLHELAGHLEWLAGDDNGAMMHYLMAAMDDGCGQGDLNIRLAWNNMLTRREVFELKVDLEYIWQHSTDIWRRKAAYDILKEIYERYGIKNNLPEWPYIKDWHILGSLDNDHGKGFNTVYDPEKENLESESYQGMLRDVSWRDIHSDGLVKLDDLMAPNRQAVAYGRVYVRAPSAGRYVLVMHSTASLVVWVNDGPVYREEYLGQNAVDNVAVAVDLAAGWNKILVKSAVQEQPWEFSAYFLDEKRQPVALESSVARQEVTVKATDVMPGETIFAKAEERLPLLKQVRLAQMRGQNRLAYTQLNGEKAVENPYYGQVLAETASREGADGPALDTLQKWLGVKNPTAVALVKRAAYYADKEIWDRATADLQASLTKYPACRYCQYAMANLMDKRGWKVEALESAKKMAQVMPNQNAVVKMQADLLQDLGHEEESRKIWQEVLKKEPGRHWAIKEARNYYRRKGQLKKAISYNGRLLGKEIIDKQLAVNQAELYHSANMDKDAEKLLRQLTEQNPDWHRSYHLLGRFAQERGQAMAAIGYYQSALACEPNNSQLAEYIDHLQNNSLDFINNYLPTDEYIEELIAGGGEVEQQRGVNTIYLLDHEVTILNQDGSSKRVVTQVTRALNTDGRDELIAERLPAKGTIKILQAYARQPDGSRQEAASIRGNVIRFRGIEVGSTTVVQYVHYAPQQVFLPQHFATDWYFQGVARQHEISEWVLAVPKNKNLLYTISNPDLVDLLQKEEGGYRIYDFSASSMPPVIKENDMPSLDDYLAKVSVTTVPTWDEYVAWDKSLVTNALQPDGKLVELAKKLTAGSRDQLSSFWLLFSYVANEIRYQNDYENTIAGVRPHAPAMVVERGYGDCKDKALLLITLGEAVGISIDYVSVRTRPYGQVNRGQPDQQFNHAIVYVPAQNGISEGFFMDPTVDALDLGNLRVDDQGTWALVMNVKSGEYRFEQIPFAPFEKELKVIDLKVDIKSSKEASAKVAIETRGQLGSGMRQLVRNNEQARQLYMLMANQLFKGARTLGAELANEHDYSKPFVLYLTLDIANSLVDNNGEYTLQIPTVAPMANEAQLESRHYPLWFLYRTGAQATTVINLPEGAKVLNLPGDYRFGEEATMLIERSSRQEKRRVEIINKWQRNSLQIEPEDYPQYRQNVNQAALKNNELLKFTLP